ncbi:MAG TPA: N-acetylmuramoyl-L-alanine amidase [Acidobacteriota bacterium]|nr:N-acetylmuramoyl-L-alanine amidase [Acidobacteriota bacterium]
MKEGDATRPGTRRPASGRGRMPWAALLLTMWATCPLFAYQDLEVEIGSQVSRVTSLRQEGRSYYRVREVAEIFDLRLSPQDDRLTLRGPRGTARLREGSVIVGRDRGPDVQLSAPVWQRRQGEWYVTVDFLDRVVRDLLDGRLTRLSPTRYRFSGLQDVEMTVRLQNHPPHRVRVVFQPARAVPIRIDDQGRVLVIDFGQFRPLVDLPEQRPDVDIVAALTFDRLGRGAIRLVKGPQYDRYEYLELTSPDRHVLDLYSSSQPRRSRGRAEVVLDPGHGGRDAGVIESLRSRSGQGEGTADSSAAAGQLSEKDYALQLAERLGRRLSQARRPAVLTRNRDVDLNLEQRSAIANGFAPKAFVSLHLGNDAWSALGGPVVYVHQPLGSAPLQVPLARKGGAAPDSGPAPERLGQTSQNGLRSAPDLAAPLKPWSEAQSGHLAESRRLAVALQQDLNRLFGTDNQVVEIPLRLLEPVDAPAVLIEIGFLSHPEDRRRLRDPVFQDRLVDSLAQALERYLQ